MPALATIRRWLAPSQPVNPYAGEVARLQEQLAKRERQLQEAALLWGDNFGWPDSPMGSRFGPGEWGSGYGIYGGNRGFPFLDRSQARDHAPLPFLTEIEWRIGVAASQDLCTRNHLAIAFQEFINNFVGPCQVQFVLRGQTPAPVASGPADADGDGSPDTDPLITACQQVWDEWVEMVDWGQGEEDREAECRSRLFRHGEAILRFFRGGSETAGLPPVRHLEPELIRSPDGANDHQKWGVETPPNDAERVTRYYVADANDPSRGQWEEASRFVRIKGNVDRSTKRGLPDLFPVAAHLRRVVGLLENMGEVAKLQAAIAWIQKYGPTASQAQVQAAIQQGQDYSAIKLPAHPGMASANTISVREHVAGSVIHAENGRVFEPGPMATGVPGFELVEKAIMRSVGLRWGCPQFFSGDGDSFASSLVTGSPFARATESRQERMKGFTRSVARKVLELAGQAGRLPADAHRRVKVVVTCKPVIIADEEKQTRSNIALFDKGLADPFKIMKEQGDDPKILMANYAAFMEKFRQASPAQPSPFGDGQPSDNPFGKDPTTAPPGSAGGDGSSGMDGLLEGRLWEGAPGPPPRPGLVWNDSTHRWRSPETGEETPHEVKGVPQDKKERAALAISLVNAVKGVRAALGKKYKTDDVDSKMSTEEVLLDGRLRDLARILHSGLGKDGKPLSDEEYAEAHREAVKTLDDLRASATPKSAQRTDNSDRSAIRAKHQAEMDALNSAIDDGRATVDTDFGEVKVLSYSVATGGAVTVDQKGNRRTYIVPPNQIKLAQKKESRTSEDRSNLIRKVITNKAGHRQTVYVSPEDADADIDHEHPVDAKAKSLLARIAEVPGQLREKVTAFVKDRYAKLVTKYGKRGAAAILAATVLLLPVPLPGTTLLPIALANAVVMLRRAVTGEGVEPVLTDEQVQAIARQLIAELYAEMGEEPPELAG